MKQIIENNSFFDIVRQVVRPDECIVEIGAGTGETTIRLLEIARDLGTKVIVIDPFENDFMPESYRYSFEDFEKRVAPLRYYLVLLKVNSLSEEAETLLATQKIGFAFIDGLQYKNAVKNDLRICWHARLICVDDADREDSKSQVPAAVKATRNKIVLFKNKHVYLY